MKFTVSCEFRLLFNSSNNLLLNYLVNHWNSYTVLINIDERKQVSYFDLNQGEDLISYLTLDGYKKSKEEKLDYFTSKYRVKAKPGKIFTRFSSIYDVKVIEKAVNIFRANVLGLGNYEFVIVRGKKIREYYLGSNYDHEDDRFDLYTLGSSCMQNKKCQDFLGIYTKNWRKVSLIAFKNCNTKKILGRAILWKNAVQGKYSLMDRVYGCDVVEQKFVNFAKENGFAARHETSDSSVESNFILPDGSIVYDEIELNLDCNFDAYPYMDTFKYSNLKDKLSNVYQDYSEDVNLESVHGNTNYIVDEEEEYYED